MTKQYWTDLSSTDFRELDKEKTLALLPIGSMEQHGPHLPVATDTFSALALVEGICDQIDEIPTVQLPIIWCSRSNEHADFPGTITLSHDTFVHLVQDISASVAAAGFRKLVIVNWHGGNTGLLTSILRDIRQSTGLMVFLLDGLHLLGAFKKPWQEGVSFDYHAERTETSIMLAKHPEKVKRMDYSNLGSDLKRGKISRLFKDNQHLMPEGGLAQVAWTTNDLSEDGVIGSPAGATPEDGEWVLQKAIDLGSAAMREIAAFTYEP
jgi:creatinine amidohydrolase